MAFAPAPPPMAQLNYLSSPGIGAQLSGLTKNLGAAAKALPGAPPAPMADPGSAVTGATGPTSVGSPTTGPMPLVPAGVQAPNPGTGVGQAQSPFAGPVPPPVAPNPAAVSAPAGPAGLVSALTSGDPSGVVQAMRGLQPTQALDVLRRMAQGGTSVPLPGMPGSAAFNGAGVMPSTMGGG